MSEDVDTVEMPVVTVKTAELDLKQYLTQLAG
jgi:hypothetical protein